MLCVEAWKAFNQLVFAASPRYVRVGSEMLEDDDFVAMQRESFGESSCKGWGAAYVEDSTQCSDAPRVLDCEAKVGALL